MARFQVVPECSQLWIEAQSSLHPIHAEATGIRGEAEITQSDGRLVVDPPPCAWIELPVEQLHSGNASQDQEMLRTLDAHRFPTVNVKLQEVTPLPQPNRYRLHGTLTFHGVTCSVQVDVTATIVGDQTLTIEGEYVLDMREYGVTPPRLLWVLQVYPQVKVRMRLVVERMT
jgi:polyisoprenoid-binding protein YceI